MKNQLCILLLALSISQLTAQLPANFAPIGTQWNCNYFAYGSEKGTINHVAMGDTLMNGAVHRIIKRTKISCDYGNCTIFKTTISQHYYTIRNDSLFKTEPNYTRFLFNFNCKLGDSLHMDLWSNLADDGVITRIADTTINNKRLKFWEFTQNCVWQRYSVKHYVYELIGSVYDGFYEFGDRCNSDPIGNSLCSMKSGDWTYRTSDYCSNYVATKEIIPFYATLYPNLASHQLTIDYSTDNHIESMKLMIHDVLGKVVHQQILDTSTSTLNINIEHLNAGMYILSVQSQGKKRFVQRFIKP
jgi:Secretion system C-terminal sorting domain